MSKQFALRSSTRWKTNTCVACWRVGLVFPGQCFGSGFLPASYQGSVFQSGEQAVANIRRVEPSAELQRNKLDLLKKLDHDTIARQGSDDQIEAAIANYETAFLMQSAVPELLDLSDESARTQRAYGMEAEFENTQTFGRQCLLARRLVERGVRFIELTCPGDNGDRWD